MCQQQQQAPRLEGTTISLYSSVSDVRGTAYIIEGYYPVSCIFEWTIQAGEQSAADTVWKPRNVRLVSPALFELTIAEHKTDRKSRS